MKICPTAFGRWSEEELQQLPPQDLRMHEAFYFYERFRAACGQQPYRLGVSPSESQFEWIANADAFLASLVGVEELVSNNRKKRLLDSNLYRLVKQLRNVTVHTTVLGGRKHKHNSPPLINRIFNQSVGRPQPASHVDPMLRVSRMRKQLRAVQRGNGKKGKWHVAGSRQYLKQCLKVGEEQIVLRELFEKALEFVGTTCGLKMIEV